MLRLCLVASGFLAIANLTNAAGEAGGDRFDPTAPHDPAHSVRATDWCAKHALAGQLAQALSDCTFALASKPNDTQAMANRGSIFLMAGDPRAALFDFDRAIQLNPREPVLFCNRGRAFDALGDVEKAIADYSTALSLEPNYPTALYSRGLLYERIGQRSDAIADFEAALKIAPTLERAREILERLRRDAL